MKLPSHRGFTLIEVMITIVIIGILLAIAVPAYSNYVIRGNRAAAQQHLMDISQRETQALADSRTYKSSVADLNMVTPPSVSKFYTISIVASNAAPPTFTVTATPISGSKQEADGNLSIDQAGTKLPSAKW
jgi:type IV pilus assembly protein PilE